MGSPWAAPMKCTEQWAASSFAWQIDHGHGQPMGSPLCCPWAAHGQQNGQLYVFFDWVPNQKKHRAAHSAAHGQPMGSIVGCPWAAHAHGQFAMQMSSLPTVHQSCPLAAHCSVHFMGAAHGLPMGRQN